MRDIKSISNKKYEEILHIYKKLRSFRIELDSPEKIFDGKSLRFFSSYKVDY